MRCYNSIDDFDIQPNIGENCSGSFGVIVTAIRKTDQKEFVMKFFGYTRNRPDVSWILRELDNLRALVGING